MPTTTNPIGITFLPSAENQADGQRRGSLEGDLGQAFKILSLRLPRVQGAKAITPPGNMTGTGAAVSVPGGFNPQAAIFEAIIRAMQGGGAPPMGTPTISPAPMSAGPLPVGITPGGSPERPRPFDPAFAPLGPTPAPAPPRVPFGGPKRTFSPAD